MQCNNPCGTSQANTPACESLPSQIQNFTDQFFGTVVKTEVNGQVVWSLPCSLDTGLPNNPRGVDEGLACYFLRLFRDGIGGLTGPKGDQGIPGTNGTNSYTATIQSFGQPNLSAPLTQIVVVPNPAIVEGMGVFVEHSGFYVVSNVAPGGVLFVTLVSPISGAPSVVPAGSLVVPGGIGPQGPVGATGPAGIQGPAGPTTTNENGGYSSLDPAGGSLVGLTNYSLTALWAVVDFTTAKPEFTPPAAGTYNVTGVIALEGQAAVSTSDLIHIQLRTSDGIVFYQTTTVVNNVANGMLLNVPVTGNLVTTGAVGQTVQVFAYTEGTPGSVTVNYLGTYLTWVRVA